MHLNKEYVNMMSADFLTHPSRSAFIQKYNALCYQCITEFPVVVYLMRTGNKIRASTTIRASTRVHYEKLDVWDVTFVSPLDM